MGVCVGGGGTGGLPEYHHGVLVPSHRLTWFDVWPPVMQTTNTFTIKFKQKRREQTDRSLLSDPFHSQALVFESVVALNRSMFGFSCQKTKRSETIVDGDDNRAVSSSKIASIVRIEVEDGKVRGPAAPEHK